jgi:hypothetical protein
MPLEQASILSPREKNVRRVGYLDLSFGRAALAACRAALLATLFSIR